MADLEKRKNALKCLKTDNPRVFWSTLKKLLPNKTRSTSGNPRPKYLKLEIPEEVKVTNAEAHECYVYLVELAVDTARNENEKLGSGLSYAELDEDKLPQTAVIEELNRVENEELRRGYYLGIINQRGVHWIDPEGKPELELAEDYENRANIAESRGYSRYAGILRVIGDEFKREAKSNILEAKNGDDE